MRSVVFSLCLLILSGCQYAPLERQENQPELADASLDREIVITGQSYVTWRQREGNGAVGSVICVVEQDVRGWAAPELNDASCKGCDEIYTLAMEVTNAEDCDKGGPSAVDIAFATFDFYDQTAGTDSNLEWLVEYESDGYMNTTWDPRGYTAWDPRMGVFDDVIPNGLEGGTDWDCDSDVCAQTMGGWYLGGDLYGRFWINIDFVE